MRGSLTLDPDRGTQEWRSQHNDSLVERRPGYTQRHRQLVMLKRSLHSPITARRSSEEWRPQKDDSLMRGSLTTLNPSWGALKSGGLSITTL